MMSEAKSSPRAREVDLPPSFSSRPPSYQDCKLSEGRMLQASEDRTYPVQIPKEIFHSIKLGFCELRPRDLHLARRLQLPQLVP